MTKLHNCALELLDSSPETVPDSHDSLFPHWHDAKRLALGRRSHLMGYGQDRGPRDPETTGTPGGTRAGDRPGRDSMPSSTVADSPLPSISVPKGGGAIAGIGEKFAVNAVTGTGALTIPIASSPGRSGFGPSLSLAYDSGSGNGPFGFGWISRCQRSPARPTRACRGTATATSPTCFLSPAQKTWCRFWMTRVTGCSSARTVHGIPYTIHLYRPRIEGLFARIERWTRAGDGISHWRSISRDNVTTLYGFDDDSRIADPADPRRIFSYLICRTFDDKGNITRYEYLAESGRNVATERKRTRPTGTMPTGRTQRYVKQPPLWECAALFP